MWENLKKKLPLKAIYTEMGREQKVTIEDMKITDEMIYFTLIEGIDFIVSCDRKWVGIVPDSRGLLIDAPHLWTILIQDNKNKGIKQ